MPRNKPNQLPKAQNLGREREGQRYDGCGSDGQEAAGVIPKGNPSRKYAANAPELPACDLADGRVREAINAYDANGCVSSSSTRNGAMAALVENYLTDVELNGSDISRLAFAHRRKDVYALNQAIRAGLRCGAPKPETLLTTETGPRAFAVGERIVFSRNDKTIGVKNGMLGTVREVDERQLLVELDADGGKARSVSFDPDRYNAFDHGYAVTIHKSQGATVEKSYVLASRTLDNPLTYVALTRHRQEMKLFVGGQDKPAWIEVARRYDLGGRRRQRQPTR